MLIHRGGVTILHRGTIPIATVLHSATDLCFFNEWIIRHGYRMDSSTSAADRGGFRWLHTVPEFMYLQLRVDLIKNGLQLLQAQYLA